MAKKNENEAPAVFGADWHLYQPIARVWVKHDPENPGKVLVADAFGASSVDVLDEAELLAAYKPCADTIARVA